MKKTTIFLTILLAFNSLISFSQTFFDNGGKALLFYNQSNNTLFDFSGNPRFYFKYESDKIIHVYNFSGQHIAWLSEGILRDHDGRILASRNGRIVNITYSIEPIKPIEKILPIKGVEQIPPIQPIFKNEFSTSGIFFSDNISSQTPSVFSQQNDYSSRANFQPYQLPADDILNAIKSLNDRHNRLLAQGYIYDARTDNYYTKEQYAAIEAKRNVISKSYYDVVAEARNASSYSFGFKNPRKKTWYTAYFGNPELGVYSAKVLIKKGGKIRGFYFTHPQYGYMFFGVIGKKLGGLSDRPKVTFPYTEVSFVGDISKFRRKEVGLLGSAFYNGSGALFWHRGMTKTSK